MKRILLLIAIFTFSNSFGQGFDWAQKLDMPAGYQGKGLVTDSVDNLYAYGNALYGSTAQPNKGSFISKYDNNGNLLFSKVWPTAFFIRQMIYSESENCLFACGSFKDTITVDTHGLSSYGSFDAFIAKLDLNGNITWVEGFGGVDADHCNGITRRNGSSIYATGTCKDTVKYNGTAWYTGDRSMFIASVTTAGVLQNFFGYDFYPAHPSYYGTNEGKYINTDPSGNILVFGEREGIVWSDTTAGPKEGQYVMKYTSSGSLLWSKFIVNGGCYYGYSYGDLEVDDLGVSYVRKRCENHYGGTGLIISLNNLTGDTIATYGIQEATYTDIQLDNGDLLVAGNENAFICPCPSSDPGDDLFKRMTPSGTVAYSEVFEEGRALALKKGNGSSLYVLATGYDSLKIGPYVFANDSGITNQQYVMRYLEPAGPTQVKKVAEKKVQLFPNPANTTLTINCTEPVTCIEMIDITGNLVKRINSSAGTSSIDIKDLAPGCYNVSVVTGNERFKERVMIVR